MERGNGNTVLLTVIGVATLLVALVGATFAYFTASVNQENTPINVTTTTLSGLTQTSAVSASTTPVYPGWVGYQTITVTADNAGVGAVYSLGITAGGDSELLPDIQYAICAQNVSTAPTITASTYGYTAGSASLGTSTLNSQAVTTYSISGSAVTLPSTCTSAVSGTISTATVADVATPYTTGTMLSSVYSETDHTQALASDKSIAAGTTDVYYIIYRFVNRDANQANQGKSFTVTPAFSVSTATYSAGA